jgi:hypothetical protein
MAGPLAAFLILAAWFCDRTDGQLARQQATASPRGAWLDANLDELADIGLHIAVAVSAAATAGPVAWWLLSAFLGGKYLFMYGLMEERSADCLSSNERCEPEVRQGLTWLARLYHFPANADVRLHLLAGSVACGCYTAELAWVAFYYNFRWAARYALVCRRLRGTGS